MPIENFAFRRFVLSLFLGALIVGTSSRAFAQQEPQRNPEGALQAFMVTATYGVVAGSLIGVASLAFYENPGQKTRNIALGASLGLYAGILLGAYVVYFPTIDSWSKEQDEEKEKDGGLLDSDPINLDSGSLNPRLLKPKTSWIPIVSWTPEQGALLGAVYNF